MNHYFDIFEREVRKFPFFKDRQFELAGRNDSTDSAGRFKTREVTLKNYLVNRSINIFLVIPLKGKIIASWLKLGRMSTEEFIFLGDYMRQHHSIELGEEYGRYRNYDGPFEDQVRGYLNAESKLLAQYLGPVLDGKIWPEIYELRAARSRYFKCDMQIISWKSI